MIPNIQSGIGALNSAMAEQYNDFADHLALKKIKTEDLPGDPSAIKHASTLTPLVQFHLHQKLGDCARLWQYMRMLNLYNPEHNVQNPVDEKGNKTTTGVPAPGTVTSDSDTVKGGSSQKNAAKRAAAKAKKNETVEPAEETKVQQEQGQQGEAYTTSDYERDSASGVLSQHDGSTTEPTYFENSKTQASYDEYMAEVSAEMAAHGANTIGDLPQDVQDRLDDKYRNARL